MSVGGAIAVLRVAGIRAAVLFHDMSVEYYSIQCKFRVKDKIQIVIQIKKLKNQIGDSIWKVFVEL